MTTIPSPPPVPVVSLANGNATPDYQSWFNSIYTRIGGGMGDLTNSSWTYTLPGGTSRLLTSKLSDIVSVLDFGADKTGAIDSTIAIQNALNSAYKRIYIPAGTYKITSTLLLSKAGTTIIGDNWGTSILRGTPGMGPVLQLGKTIGYNFNNVESLSITYLGTPHIGDYGLQVGPVLNNLCYLKDLYITNCWEGLHLGPTGYSKVIRCFITNNYSNGIFVGNDTSNAPGGQWSISDTLSQLNDGAGLWIEAANKSGSMTCGEIIGFSTYANTLGGIVIKGKAICPIYAPRISNCFLGNDGTNGEIYLDTYGTYPIKISDCYLELAGAGTTGHAFSTSATNIGDAIHITANNSSVNISGTDIINPSQNGIYCGGTTVHISSSNISYCGLAGDTSNQFGVYATNGSVSISSNDFWQNPVGIKATAGCSYINIALDNNLYSNTTNIDTSLMNANNVYGINGILKAPVQVNDVNGNSIFKYVPTSSAVNYIEVFNSTTGNAPTIAATGSDSNIGLTFSTTQASPFTFLTTKTSNQFVIQSGTAIQKTSNFNFANTAATYTYTFPDSNGTIVLGGGTCSGTCSGTNTGDQTISDATISTSDITTNNVSTSKHGFAPKAPNDATKYLDGSGAYSVPIGSSGASAWAAWTPGWTGFSVNPTVVARYQTIGKTCNVYLTTTANGTSNATTFTITGLPVTPSSNIVGTLFFPCLVTNAGTNQLGIAEVNPSSTTITMTASAALGAWTATGNKAAYLNFSYETV